MRDEFNDLRVRGQQAALREEPAPDRRCLEQPRGGWHVHVTAEQSGIHERPE